MRSIIETLWPLAGILLSAYLALLLFLYFSQPGMLYYPSLPSRALVTNPSQINLEYETLTLTTSDGLKLNAWFLPAKSPRATLLFHHGNAGNISHRLDSLRLFNKLDFSVLIFDYRGYGRSEGKPNEQGSYEDARTAWRYLTETRGIAPEKIILFGRSLGAAVATDLATETKPMGLVLESTFTSVPDMAAELYPWLPVRWLSRFQYNTLDKLQQIRVPLLIIHSRDDEIIPYSHGQRLFKMAPEPKQFIELSGGHNDGFWVSRVQYLEGWKRFMNNLSTNP